MKDGIEVERKFLVRDGALPPAAEATRIEQAYLGFEPAVRVRIENGRGTLTVKGAGLLARREVELEIGVQAARALVEMRVPGTAVVRKTRHRVDHGGEEWIVDVFEEELAGLVLAEIELADPDQPFQRPPWVDREVTSDPAFQNSNLARAGRNPLS